MEMRTSRKYTNRILEMVDDGVLDKDFLIQNLLMYMSEADVSDFFDKTIYDVDYDEDEDEET
jgi:hypothetical protein